MAGSTLPIWRTLSPVVLTEKAVLEITVGYQILSDQILKMTGKIHIMIGRDERTSHRHILSYLLQGDVSE